VNDSVRGGGETVERRRRPEGAVTIDIHCHVGSTDADQLARPFFSSEKDPFVHFAGPASAAYNERHFADIVPKLTVVQERLADMDRMGIDIQAISVAPPQYYYWAEPDLGQKLARMQNDNIASVVAEHPDRFVGLGTVPLQDVSAALDELERIAHDLRFPGIEICTNACDPVAQTGCANGLHCIGFSMTDGDATDCTPPGNRQTDQTCSDTNECIAGDICVNTGTNSFCLEYCEVGIDTCAGSLICQGFTDPMLIGGTEYGACN